MIDKICFLCSQTPIHTTTDSYYNVNGKLICTSCVDDIHHNKLNIKPVDIQTITTEIVSDQPIDIGDFKRCPSHNHKLRLSCETCSTFLCVMCVPEHSDHRFLSAVEKSREIFKAFYQTELICKYIQQSQPGQRENAKKISDDCIIFYYSLEGASPQQIQVKGKLKLDQGSSYIKGIFPSFKDKKINDIYQQLTKIDEPYQRQDDVFLHWCQWNSKNVNLVYLSDDRRVAFSVNSDVNLPHFCRSIQISPSKILVCGGRTQPSTMGLPTACIIDINDYSVQQISSMHVGRANHALMYYLGHVYVIGGCDDTNKYTNKCERLELRSLKWEKIASTNQVRDSTTAIGIHQENMIYAFGSRRANLLCTDTIEKYDVARDIWISMNLKLTFSSMVLGSFQLPEQGKKVLVYGGQNGNAQALNFINKLDLETGTVEEIENGGIIGGCIVNEPLVYEGVGYSLFFKGTNARTLAKWSNETNSWVILQAKRI